MGKKTKTEPTGQAVNRRRATRLLQNRLTLAQKEVMRLFREIPRKRRQEVVLPNANKVIPVYDYQITAGELEDLTNKINVVVSGMLETIPNRMDPNWWWKEVIEPPYRTGTAEEIVEFNQLVTSELVRTRTARGLTTQRLEIGHVLQSSEYLEALDEVYVTNYRKLKKLGNDTTDRVMLEINAGIDGHQTPTEIAKNIEKRFDVSRSDAKRIAETEVNKAYNNARLDATDIAAKQTGLRSGVIHLSALVLTTRSEHAARHGNAYTVAQQRQWWDSGSNRINCKCSTRSVLIDNNSKVIDVELQEEIQAEKDFFDKES